MNPKKTKVAIYARVSTTDQRADLQLDALRQLAEQSLAPGSVAACRTPRGPSSVRTRTDSVLDPCNIHKGDRPFA